MFYQIWLRLHKQWWTSLSYPAPSFERVRSHRRCLGCWQTINDKSDMLSSLILTPLTAKPLMYMSVPPTQKLSPFEAVVVVDAVEAVIFDEVVVVSLHSQWQVSIMLAQFSVISSVQQGSDSAVTHSDWDWNIIMVSIIIIIIMCVVTMEHWSGRGRQSIQQ